MGRFIIFVGLFFACGEAATVDLEGSQSDAGIACHQLLDEPSCSASGCTWAGCSSCGSTVYSCQDSAFAPACAPPEVAPFCPPPCELLDEPSCAASPSCHRVFVDDLLCDCASPGCCARFLTCAPGDLANCSSDNLACRRASPRCEGPYVISYVDTCYEGCALATECAD